MPILDAALAFALTMLMVATLVTQIVHFMVNTAKFRNGELQKMMKEYFTEELQPVVQWELARLKKNVGDQIVSDLSQVAERFKDSELELFKKKENELATPKNSELFKENELATLVEMSTEELTERLKRSSLGKKLLEELGDQAQAVFDDLGWRYDTVCDKFTESFRTHSRRWATVVALVLAFVLNIDSIHIADSYIKNEGLRQDVIAQNDAFVEDYNSLMESLEKEGGNNAVTKEELKQAFSNSQKQLDSLRSAGFPIGPSYFPYSGLQKGKSKDFQSRNNVCGWILWVLGILLTAVLAGLGAPFWYDTITGISRVVQRVRSVKKAADNQLNLSRVSSSGLR